MITGLELSLIGAALLVGVAVGYLSAQLLAGRRREEQLSQLVSPLQAALEATRTQAHQQLDLAAQAGLRIAVFRIELLRLGARGFERGLQWRHQLR